MNASHTNQVSLVAAGPGDPGLLTVCAVGLLHAADVIVTDPDCEPMAAVHARPDAQIVVAVDDDGQIADHVDRVRLMLEPALAGFSAWITGRKRFHGGARMSLPVFEFAAGRYKVNPLAGWNQDDVDLFMEQRGLPRHPMVAQGYPSIGCMPCTTPVKPGEDPRAGRWRDSGKVECGIHFDGEKWVRTGAAAGPSFANP